MIEINNIAVRKSKPKDLATLREIYLAARKKHFIFQNVTTFKLSDFDRDTLAEEILVAEKSGEIIGFLSLYEPDYFIHLLFVKPGFERLGIGRQLLDSVQEIFSLTELRLKCLIQNKSALAFYKKYGFVVEAEGGMKKVEKYFVLYYTSME